MVSPMAMEKEVNGIRNPQANRRMDRSLQTSKSINEN